MSTAIHELEQKLVPSGPGVSRYLNVPNEGWNNEQVRAELEKLAGMKHTRWEDGQVSGAVYHGGQELLRLQFQAMEMFGVANPIHPDVFPGVRKMEAEVVAMVILIYRLLPLVADWRLGPCNVQRAVNWRGRMHERRYRVNIDGGFICSSESPSREGRD